MTEHTNRSRSMDDITKPLTRFDTLSLSIVSSPPHVLHVSRHRERSKAEIHSSFLDLTLLHQISVEVFPAANLDRCVRHISLQDSIRVARGYENAVLEDGFAFSVVNK